MAHSAFDDQTNLKGEYSIDYWTPFQGWQHSGVSTSYPAASRMCRPQSTVNPVRQDGTRSKAAWYGYGGRSVSRSLTAEYTPFPTLVFRYSGEPESPLRPWELGQIPLVDDNLEATVMRQCLAQFTERDVQLNAATREIGSTFKMVGNMATGLAHGLDDLMAREFPRERMSSWKKLPSAYLQYLYGWAPIADDVSNAFSSLLKRNAAGEKFYLSLRKTAKRQGSQLLKRDIFMGQIPVESMFTLTQVSRAVMDFVLPAWYFDRLPTVSGFGSLYESTPYSFVLDWFIPIGEWIGAVESAQLWPFFMGGTRSTQMKRTLLYDRMVARSDGQTSTQGSVRSSSEDYSYTRQVVNSMQEGIIFARPSLRNPLSLSHAAQGLSLLTQIFQKWR